jgi:cytochrome c551/c552
MNRTLRWCAAILGIALAAGCGGGKVSSDAPAAKSPYDAGPRAGESPFANVFATKGEVLFKGKGCSACHAFGQRLTCPDLKGVTMRRTSEWMQHQILHPEIMTKEDPIAKELFATYMTQMPNQGLTQEEALLVIDFIKKKDHELGVIQ